MKQIVTQKIEITEEERIALFEAKEVLNNVADELQSISSYMIDDQIIPVQIEEVLRAALRLENAKIFSVFNELSDDKRREIANGLAI